MMMWDVMIILVEQKCLLRLGIFEMNDGGDEAD
jgi:hypothetical protein